MKSSRAAKSKVWSSSAARSLLSMAGDPTTIEDAVQVVIGGLLENVYSPPTDLTAIARRLNVCAIEEEDLPGSGELRREGTALKIVHSRYLSPGRRRFTIAHELGHAIFLNSPGPTPRSSKELEQLCNMLAAEMLMPRSSFMHHAGSSLSLSKFFALSKNFQTSLSATAIRCAELLRVAIFEVDNNRVTWSPAIVKSGPLTQVDRTLHPGILRALQGQSGEDFVYVNWRGDMKLCQLQYSPVGKGRRALFLLQPCPSAYGQTAERGVRD